MGAFRSQRLMMFVDCVTLYLIDISEDSNKTVPQFAIPSNNYQEEKTSTN